MKRAGAAYLRRVPRIVWMQHIGRRGRQAKLDAATAANFKEVGYGG